MYKQLLKLINQTINSMDFSSDAPEQKNFIKKKVIPVVNKVLPVAQRVLPVAATFVPALAPVATVVGAIGGR